MLDDLRVVTEKKGRLEGDDDDGDDEQTETFDDYQMRVNAFVAAHLAGASSSKRDDYKDGQVYQERKNVIHEFLKATISKKCQNPTCGAYVTTYSLSQYYDNIPPLDTPIRFARRATQNLLNTTFRSSKRHSTILLV